MSAPVRRSTLRSATTRQPQPLAPEAPGTSWFDPDPAPEIIDRVIDDRRPAARAWYMEDWLGRGVVTGLYGQGGVRKTDWLLQAMIAGGLGVSFCGFPIARSTVVGWFCEDDEDEIQRRAHRLLAFYGRDVADLGGRCHYSSLVNTSITEFVEFDFGGRMHGTPVFELFRQRLGDLKPALAVLDTSVAFFGGNENDRRQVSGFLRLLNRLATDFDCAIVFSAHPSRRGLGAPGLDSGSTAWENGSRCRLTLHDPGDGQEGEQQAAIRPPSDRRILTRVKSNYAKPGEQIELVLRDGGFFPAAIDPAAVPKSGPLHDRVVEAKFLELLHLVDKAGGYVSDSSAAREKYAPHMFSQHPLNDKKFGKKDFERAMIRLLTISKRIRIERFGPPSRPQSKIVAV